MSLPLLFSLLSLLSLVPLAVFSLRAGGRGDDKPLARSLLLVAATGCLVAFLGPLLSASGWPAGFSTALWLSLAVSLFWLSIASFIHEHLLFLLPIFAPYAAGLALIATIWSGTAETHRLLEGMDGLFWVHVGFSVLTYAAMTLAAIAGVAVLVQQTALKSKRPSRLSRALPALAEAEAAQTSLLRTAAVVLFAGIVTGVAIRLLHGQSPFPFDHKTLLSLAAFAVIVVLLVLQGRSGLRGQRAVRLALAAYLLLTLGYPGVKFVTDALLA